MIKNNQATRPSLLIVYDFFYPGYKAGGPIQSLTNLAIALQSSYTICVFTSAYDLNSNSVYDNIAINSWNPTILPSNAPAINIYYADKKSNISKQISQLLILLKPDIIYLNGIFSYRFFIIPLLSIKRAKNHSKLVVCPRGMLQQGALEGKPFKKKIYLLFLKISGLLKNTFWHATNTEEMGDIKKIFGQDQQVMIASNIPKKPASAISFSPKQPGQLRLIYLSLIAEKKNLLFLLQIIQQCNGVSLDIFGPVKDIEYWKKCKSVIAQLPGKVSYKGEVNPEEVQDVFKHYDASVLLTKGENFGHALYESLSVGRPVITSKYTPWINLERQKAGWNIDIVTINEGVLLFNDLMRMPADGFNEYFTGAHALAKNYYNNLNSIEEYSKLF